MATPPKPESIRVSSMIALARALGAHGGYALPKQAYDWIRSNTDLPKLMPLDTKLAPSDHFEREVRFGRQELAEGGLLATADGSWRLLDSASVNLTPDAARLITRENTRRRRARREVTTEPEPRLSSSPAGAAPTKGPRPVAWQGIVTRELGPAATYLLRFEGSDIWKVGFAVDVESRLREINQHVPVELLNRRWLLVKTKQWPSAELAHRMEQAVLARLCDVRTVYERVSCSGDSVEVAWDEAAANTLQG